GENSVYLGVWIEGFRSVRSKLQKPLARVFRDRHEKRAAQRNAATDILADYVALEPEVLADLLMDADDEQFTVLYPKLKAYPERATASLSRELDRKAPTAWNNAAFDPVWTRSDATLADKMPAARALLAERLALSHGAMSERLFVA